MAQKMSKLLHICMNNEVQEEAPIFGDGMCRHSGRLPLDKYFPVLSTTSILNASGLTSQLASQEMAAIF